jgi:hypothetical protein
MTVNVYIIRATFVVNCGNFFSSQDLRGIKVAFSCRKSCRFFVHSIVSAHIHVTHINDTFCVKFFDERYVVTGISEQLF